jgi:hypothetical protein
MVVCRWNRTIPGSRYGSIRVPRVPGHMVDMEGPRVPQVVNVVPDAYSRVRAYLSPSLARL